MASGSTAYSRIRRELFALVEAIPEGKVMHVAALGTALNIPPRHVAYVLSQLREDERKILPWFRVVPRHGAFPKAAKRSELQIRQIALLQNEGVRVDAVGAILFLDQFLMSPPMHHSKTIWAEEPDD